MDSDLRITMDYDVYYRTEDLDLHAPPGGRVLLEPGQALVEIKTAAAMPQWQFGDQRFHGSHGWSGTCKEGRYVSQINSAASDSGGMGGQRPGR